MAGTYTTKQGDMWDAIAYHKLGDVSYTGELMNLNQEYREYYTFPAGIVLQLPDVPVGKAPPMPPWKRRRP